MTRGNSKIMAVEACAKSNLMNDMDDDEEPLVFKRSSSSSKQSQSNPHVQKSSSSQKLYRQSGRLMPDVRSPNGQSSVVQKGKTISSPPVKSPLLSPEASNSSAKTSPLRSPVVNTKHSMINRLGNVDKQTKVEKQLSGAADGPNESDDSDDDKPLSARIPAGSNSSSLGQKPSVLKQEESDDEKPLSHKVQKSTVGTSSGKSYDSDEEKPLAAKINRNGSTLRDSVSKKPSAVLIKRPASEVKSAEQSSTKKLKLSNSPVPTNNKQASVRSEPKVEEEDDEEHIPISQRMKKPAASDKKSSAVKKEKKPLSSSLNKTNKKSKKVIKESKKSKKVIKESKYSKSSKVPPGSGEGQKWTTLIHNGVIFPPPYKPHGVKMLYKGKPVVLTPEQEEVATMFALMLDTEYMSKPIFKENFMSDWKKILGKNHIIQSLEHCDFTPIYEWHQKEKEKKKQMTTEEKKALREEKLKQEEKYMWAIVDGVKEKVGNFRVEPPGLFRGRGEHPKMGKLKKRIRPSDITINIGKDAPIPECPIRGESWKEIRHDNTVTWLAFWNDPINPKEFKYVFLAASSTLKGQSDKEKYEKSRLLKDYIQGIRSAYTKDFASKDPTKKQIAVATYLIDKLALRAGNEKDDDEADTVGCCTLKVENVEPIPPNILKFDFLGKDSIRFQKEVEVESAAFKAIQQFRSGKKGGDDLFDKLDTSKLNAHLKELMPGLTAKVFRTYNASITLDEMLSRAKGGDVAEKVAVYQHANKEVAIICNHQRAESKSHRAQMMRLNEKIDELKGVLEELTIDLGRAKKGKPPLKSEDGKTKRNLNPEALEKKIAQTRAKIEKMERDKETKEDLKTVATGTSKTNYLDPRISVAWCKRHEVPIEKIFSKSQLAKFIWAMDVEPSFRF